MRTPLFIFILLFSINAAYAQQKSMNVQDGIFYGDTVQVKKTTGKYYNPKTAAKRSAFIPGWGQIYNNSWWKVPMIYGGFGVALYYVDLNNKNFKFYLNKIDEENAKDPQERDENLLRIYSRRADTWRGNRDLVVLTMIGLYGLQIIDATVDAHLKGFNVDENLALNLKPKMGVISNGTPFIGLKITLPIGQ